MRRATASPQSPSQLAGAPAGKRQVRVFAQAANLSLHGPHESVFEELDVLLGASTDAKEQESGKNIVNALSQILKSAEHGRKVAISEACCDDLLEEPTGEPPSADQVFAQLERTAGQSGSLAVDSPKAAAKLSDFENEVRRLVEKVKSEGQLLSQHFPVESPTEDDFSHASARREFEVTAPAAASPSGASSLPSGDPIRELEALLALQSDELKEDQLECVSRLSAQLNASVAVHQKVKEETTEIVERFLKGEGNDGHPMDQAHAAWRRKTLQTLQRTGRPGGQHGAPRKPRGVQGPGRRHTIIAASSSTPNLHKPIQRLLPNLHLQV